MSDLDPRDYPDGFHVAVCRRTADLDHPHVPSVRRHCARCQAEVWVALSTPKSATPICGPCAEVLIALDPNPVMMPPTPAQLAERAWRGDS